MTEKNTILESTLDAVCTLVTDGTHDTPPVVDSGYPLIKAKEIVGGRIDFESCARIGEEEHFKVIARSKPERGDTLFAHIGASLGEAAHVGTTRPFSIKNIALFKPNPDIIYPRYLYFLVIGPVFQEMAKAARTGSAQPFLSLGHLRGHKIRFHKDITVQKKIATILSTYDDLIENNERRIKILEEMAQNLYREWFVNFRFPGHEKVKLVDSPLGKIPEGWDVGRLDDALVLQRGFDLPKKQRRTGTIPIYAATGISGYHSEGKVKGPGVVTGRSGSLGEVTYVESDFWPLNTTLWVKEFRRATPLYSYYLLRKLGLKQYNSGVAVPTLNRNDIHGLNVLLPPRSVLSEFDSIVLNVFGQTRCICKKNRSLRETRDLLLPKLISGEVDVSELDIEISEVAA